MTLDQQRIVDRFERNRHHLQAALDHSHGEFALADILQGLLEGNLQIWEGERFAAVTEVINYPQQRIVFVHLAGGDLTELVEADEELTRFAQIVGAKGIELSGRRGWVRALASRGYKESSVQLFKEV